MDWTENDAIILLAAAADSPAADRQDYDSRRPWVNEIADFLGRSPGSISFHLGNIASAREPGVGLPHAGRVFRTVVERYHGHPRELQVEATRIRRERFEQLASPRLEVALTEAEAAASQAELERRFPEARLPPDAIIIYRYTGSIWLGVMATIQTALEFPQGAADLFRVAREVLGPRATPNTAAQDALDGRTVELAERVLIERAPKLHYSDLTPEDRIKLALLLPGLRSLRKWRPRASRLDLISASDLAQARARIQALIHIDASRLSPSNVQMLLDALEDAEAAGRL